MSDETLISYLQKDGISFAKASRFLKKLDEKVWINPSMKEHQEVEQYAYGFVKAILDKMEEIVPGHGINLIKSGSYYSNVRVGRPYEFDYMLEIPTPNITSFKWGDGATAITYDIEIDGNGVGYINGILIKGHLYDLFDVCISQLKMEPKWEIEKWSTYCNFQTEDSPAMNCLLVFNNNNRRCGISIDLVPCLKYPLEHLDKLPLLKPEILNLIIKCLDEGDKVENKMLSTNVQCEKGSSKIFELLFEQGYDLSSCSEAGIYEGSSDSSDEGEAFASLLEDFLKDEPYPSKLQKQHDSRIPSWESTGDEKVLCYIQSKFSEIGDSFSENMDPAILQVTGPEYTKKSWPVDDRSLCYIRGRHSEGKGILSNKTEATVLKATGGEISNKSQSVLYDKSCQQSGSLLDYQHLHQALHQDPDQVTARNTDEVQGAYSTLSHETETGTDKHTMVISGQGNPLDSCSKHPKLLQFFSKNLYLVFKDGYRLSTSLIEQYIMQHLNKDHLRALRIVKYLLQTYHINPFQADIDHNKLFGPPSSMQSRVLTVNFFQMALNTDQLRCKNDLEIEQYDTLNAVSFLLERLVVNDINQVSHIAYGGIFEYDVKMQLKDYTDLPTFIPIFDFCNLLTIQKFLYASIQREDLDGFYLTARENVCCQCCLSAFHGQTIYRCHPSVRAFLGLSFVDHFDKERDLSSLYFDEILFETCYMHTYMGGCKLQDCVCSLLVYTRHP